MALWSSSAIFWYSGPAGAMVFFSTKEHLGALNRFVYLFSESALVERNVERCDDFALCLASAMRAWKFSIVLLKPFVVVLRSLPTSG